MARQNSCFQFEDFLEELAVPGYYPCSITSARFRQSANDNRMLQVVYTLGGIGSAHPTVADYFVLEGPRISPSGIALSRRRLVELYRACGLDPQEGEPITPAALVDARLQVRVEQEHWQGRPRLRVVGYRPFESFDAQEEQIPF
jgi:hypothetical protein